MRVCLVGGIFGKPPEYRATVTRTPETTLADGLRARGHTVVERGHTAPFDFGGFDVVHVHHLGAGAVAAASARERLRLAFTPHGLRQASRARHAAMRYVMARAQAVVPLSQAEARWQRDEFPGVEARQHVIPNGIDESIFRFEAALPPAPGEPWRAVFVGQLVALKGVEFLLTAISMLDPALDVGLDLVYQVPTEEPALRRQAEQLGLRRVRFLGARPPAELARVYAGSHLLVLPSVTEALPSVVSEALFVGRPVVATDVGAVAEQVGDFGQIVAPRDPVALARAIEGILAGYDGYVSASADASRAAVARYSVGAMVDGHERMYARLAEIEPAQRGAAARVGDGAVRLAAGVRFGR